MIKFRSLKYKWLKCPYCKTQLFASVSSLELDMYHDFDFNMNISADCLTCDFSYRRDRDYYLDDEKATFNELLSRLRESIDA